VDNRDENPKIDPKARAVPPAAKNFRKSRRETFLLNATQLSCISGIN
jgi:hypothetical protein